MQEPITAVIGSCMNAGQYCCGTERIYVVEDVYDEFVEKVVYETKKLNQSSEGFSDIGATFWDKQLDIIEDHVEDAVQKGAHILVGGKRNPSLKGPLKRWISFSTNKNMCAFLHCILNMIFDDI